VADQQTEVWILGATGRIGRTLAPRIAARTELVPVLAGRDPARLAEVRAGLDRADLDRAGRTIVAASPTAMAEEIRRRRRPAIVVNLLGSYADTAATIARACMPGGDYIDLAADFAATPALLELNEEAAKAGSSLITGAGFGVLATEAVVIALCAGRSAPARVRADALASVAMGAGVMGTAFAASTVDVLAAGGRAYRDGKLTRIPLGSNVQRLALPDGTTVKSAAVPSSELFAARSASGAPSVLVTSALAPTSPVARAILPAAGALLSVPAVRRFAVSRLASMRTKAAPRPRPHSWGHAVIDWPDGTRREGWLRADDAMDYTADAVTAAVIRLAGGDRPVGAWTPAAAFGPELATAAGGTFILD
jgi:short subunit dehydrogenase-like uncharacterized protein